MPRMGTFLFSLGNQTLDESLHLGTLFRSERTDRIQKGRQLRITGSGGRFLPGEQIISGHTEQIGNDRNIPIV